MGYPIEIVKISHDHRFILNEEALSQILDQDDVKNRSLVIVSMAGVFDTSKDLLLNFFLRYMNSRYNLTNASEDWLDETQPLQGYSWCDKSQCDFAGILIWSEIFRTELPNGEKVAVIIMNSQGSFGSLSITDHECASIFALSTKLSSVQLYVLANCISKEDLQQLQFFTEYGRLAQEKSSGNIFQRLQILVSNWAYPYEHEYGSTGGHDYLLKILGNLNSQNLELLTLKQNLKSFFSKISCFLMPHSSFLINQNLNLNSCMSEIRSEYKEQMKALVQILLAPENLAISKIGSKTVTAASLLEHFKNGVDFYQNLDLLNIQNCLNETYNLLAKLKAVNIYKEFMNTLCRPDQPYLNNRKLQSAHYVGHQKAIEYFNRTKKLGYDEASNHKYYKNLIQSINETYEDFKRENEYKFKRKIWLNTMMFTLFSFFGLTIWYLFRRRMNKSNLFNNLKYVCCYINH